MTNRKNPPKKTALITGPAGNLGRSVVEKLFQEGVQLILVDRHPDRILHEFSFLDSAEHLLIPGIDLAAPSSPSEIGERLAGSPLPIDYLIHTVGGFQAGKAVHQISQENWDKMMAINVLTFLNIIKTVLPSMIDRQSGKIFSIGAKPALKGKKRMGSYSASKAALLRVTEAISAENREAGISAYCLIPGTIDTPENREAMPNADRSRWIPPAQIADKIYQLCLSGNPVKETIIPF